MRRFGLDVDGVVLNWEESVHRHRLAEFGGPVVGPARSWYWIKHRVPPEQWQWMWDERGGLHDIFRDQRPYRGAIAGVRRLARRFKIVVITAAPSRTAGQLKRMRFEQLDIPFNEWHVIPTGEPKSAVPCDVYLDDNSEVVNELCRNTTANVLLWDRWWNRTEPPAFAVPRVRSWLDVQREVG